MASYENLFMIPYTSNAQKGERALQDTASVNWLALDAYRCMSAA